MTRKEIVKEMRRLLPEAARTLPDTEYCCVSYCTEYTDKESDDAPCDRGNLHQIIFMIEEDKS